MTRESQGPEEPRWLLEPPAPDTVNFVFQAGEGTQLTPEVQAALEQLVAALGMGDVSGYASCSTLHCGVCRPLGPCPDYGLHPCYINFGCTGLVHCPQAM